jgi:hypothetical protein
VELFAWLGWLQGGEIFDTGEKGSRLVSPSEGGRHNLPRGVGAVLLRLMTNTKLDQTKTANMVLVWHTASGFKLGFWTCELISLRKDLGYTSAHPIGRMAMPF